MLSIALLQRAASFQADAPVGTGIEWLTLAAIFVPAVLLVVLVYWGAQETVGGAPASPSTRVGHGAVGPSRPGADCPPRPCPAQRALR